MVQTSSSGAYNINYEVVNQEQKFLNRVTETYSKGLQRKWASVMEPVNPFEHTRPSRGDIALSYSQCKEWLGDKVLF